MSTTDAAAVRRGCESTGSAAPTDNYDANTGTGTKVTKCNNAMLCNVALMDTAPSKS